jgi:hypothetical protein
MGSFPNSEGCEYTLVAIDYVSKWVEAHPSRAVDAMHSKKMLHEVIFPRYGVPRIVISDGGSHLMETRESLNPDLLVEMEDTSIGKESRRSWSDCNRPEMLCFSSRYTNSHG